MNKGFTLIEVMVAILVLALGVVGVYALVPAVIRVTAVNTTRFVASQLAREGIELIRNIRDTNWLERVAWDEGLAPGGNYGVQYNGDSLIENWGANSLQINSGGFYGYNGQFGYSGGTDTKFKRKIIITSQGEGLNVKVQIILPGESSPFEVQENLYDWR